MNYTLGIDGKVPFDPKADTTCVPANLCDYTETGLACLFKGLLPSGPIWDRDKEDPNNGVTDGRTSMVAYAAYLGKVAHSVIENSIWAAVRESNPWTAATTLDEWMDRLGWQDCYGACRAKGLTALSPFEIMGECGPIYCAPQYTEEYDRAYKSAIVKALYRLRLGIIPTIDAINFVLEPLGAGVEVSWKDDEEPTDGNCHPDLICVRVVKVNDFLEVPKVLCSDETKVTPLNPGLGCNLPMGLPQTVWPTLMAAECILRAILPINITCVLPTPCYDSVQ